MAEAWGVSAQNVRYWVKRRGAPHERGPDGEYLFDLAAVTAWYRANRIDGGRGGVRRDAGRRPKKPAGADAPKSSDAAAATPGASDGPGGGGGGRPGGPSGDAMEDLPEEVRALAKLDRQLLDRVLLAHKILTEQTELHVMQGKLLKAEDAQAAWTRAARSAGTLLRSLSRSLPETLCARLGVEPTAEKVAAAQRVLERALDEVCQRLLGAGGSGGEV